MHTPNRECLERMQRIEQTIYGDGNGNEGIARKVERLDKYSNMVIGGWAIVCIIWAIATTILKIHGRI